jgi:transcriptional regulator with PAS, ATPase and Fis domain
MSSRHAELRRDSDGWQLVDLDSKNGSLVNGARVQAARIGDGDLIQLAHTFFRFHAAQQIVGSMASIARGTGGVLTTLSPVFAAVISTAAAVARTRVAVLVRGETGTGKEVLARAIHDLSGRSGAFVAINCGAIATNLVESELFGYRKGSFSGALHDHPGLVRSSHGGTLFLDEIGDLPSSAQAALLRVLQESEVMPVGGLRPELVNLRVVAATHRDLDDLVAQGAFRRDLLARLDGVTLDVPPLRDRREDVPLVIASLLHRLAPERYDVTFTPDAARALLDHTWPHNVRELEQALAGALAVSGVGAIARRHLPRALREATESVAQRELTGEERRHRDGLIEILRDHRGNLSAVARAMGKGRTQVVRWLERYGLDADEFRTD